MESNQILAILGLLFGASFGFFGLWWGRKKAAENRGLDERYASIMTKSFASAWKITLVSIYILFALVIFGVVMTAAEVLGILLLIHFSGWTVSIIYYNSKF